MTSCGNPSDVTRPSARAVWRKPFRLSYLQIAPRAQARAGKGSSTKGTCEQKHMRILFPVWHRSPFNLRCEPVRFGAASAQDARRLPVAKQYRDVSTARCFIDLVE
jgi:hypothetical protein